MSGWWPGRWRTSTPEPGRPVSVTWGCLSARSACFGTRVVEKADDVPVAPAGTGSARRGSRDTPRQGWAPRSSKNVGSTSGGHPLGPRLGLTINRPRRPIAASVADDRRTTPVAPTWPRSAIQQARSASFGPVGANGHSEEGGHRRGGPRRRRSVVRVPGPRPSSDDPGCRSHGVRDQRVRTFVSRPLLADATVEVR